MAKDETADLLKKVHAEQLGLCDTLEQIADSLPDRVDRQLCLKTAQALAPVVARAHRLEEDWLFPKLKVASLPQIDSVRTLERLRAEHAGDSGFADELCEVLLSYGEGKPLHSAETTGYMLRGFFESLRRHIAFEQALIVPLMEAGQRPRFDGPPKGV